MSTDPLTHSQVTQSVVVSVIIPCYDYGKFLKDALESLLGQTYPYWECLIIDDGSIDDTCEIASEFARSDRRFKYYRQQNLGVSAARNKGLAIASGRYIQFLDADDKLEAEKLTIHVDFLERNPEVDIVYGDVVYFGDCLDALTVSEISRGGASWMPRVSGSRSELLQALVKGNTMVINAPMIRSYSVSSVGYFNTGLRGHEDWEYWIRWAISGRCIRYLDKDGARAMVRVHECSASQDSVLMLTSHVEVRNWLRGYISEDETLSKENDYRTALYLLRVAKIQMARGEARHAVYSASIAIWRARFRPDVVAGTLCLVLPDNVVQRLKGISRKLRFFS